MEQPELGLTARADVKRIVDGDTVDVEIRLPCRVRLLDCYAPEMRQAAGVRAAEQLAKLMPVGTEVVLQIPTTGASNMKDVFTFGRVLGRVWAGGVDVGKKLIAKGFAEARNG